jgi:hypothetical protein
MLSRWTGSRLAARGLLALAFMLLAPSSALADPADINAAARGVVRVVIVETNGEELVPVSHGTGFAVGADQIVTNAHVIAEARENSDLAIAVVPSDGDNPAYARIAAVDPRTDLALLTLNSPMGLPPLTISGNPEADSGSVTAVGYPMNVDRAQGLSIQDIFRAQPPVKSTGFLSGRRPTREFDSVLHTAPIARGNSGGPLLDDCGRVVGVNSFGAESGSADAEFFFAVSTRELLPFLRANDITARVNGLPCRSLAEIEAEERQRSERARVDASARAAAEQQSAALRQEEARREAEFALLAERESGLVTTMILLMAALASSGLAVHAYHTELRHNAEVGFALAALAVVAAGVAWETRPGFEQIEARVAERLRDEASADENRPASAAAQGELVCVIDPARSRVTGAATDDVPFEWSEDGCVNGRTQYGLANGEWARVFVPDDEAAVSVNRFDPATGEYRMERYLLGREAMARVRTARAEFQAPACGAGEGAAREFGARQAAILSLLPERPNERLVYTCTRGR